MSGPDLGIPGISEATQVGQGSFGVVYRARQDAIDRTVAVKVLVVSELDDEENRRFERECRALGALSGHSHIVAIFDSGVSAQGRPYLVMDYLPGGTLAQRLQRNGPLPWEDVALIGVKLAGAVASAHDAGVLHRDIKPENVLFSAYDEPQIVDFGIARLRTGSQSRPSVINASLAHAAPEVLSGEAAQAASDVYSLASTLYALLAGHAPFARPGDETFHPMLARMLTEDPPDLRGAGVPDSMWSALREALAKDPAERTASARSLAEALQAAQRAGGLAETALVLPARPAATGAPAADRPDVVADASAPTVTLAKRPPAPSLPAATRANKRWTLVLAITGAIVALIAMVALIVPHLPDPDPDPTPTATTAGVVTQTTPAAEPVRPSASPPAPPPGADPPPPAPAPNSSPAAPPPNAPSASADSSPSSRPTSRPKPRPKPPPRKPRPMPPPRKPPAPPALPPAQPVQPPKPSGAVRAACSDGRDNDRDGKIDVGRDPGCSSAADPAEREAACSDGRDNDRDGKIDVGRDPGCSSGEDLAEQEAACSDGRDNDQDGKIDVGKDPQCASAEDPAEKQ